MNFYLIYFRGRLLLQNTSNSAAGLVFEQVEHCNKSSFRTQNSQSRNQKVLQERRSKNPKVFKTSSIPGVGSFPPVWSLASFPLVPLSHGRPGKEVGCWWWWWWWWWWQWCWSQITSDLYFCNFLTLRKNLAAKILIQRNKRVWMAIHPLIGEILELEVCKVTPKGVVWLFSNPGQYTFWQLPANQRPGFWAQDQ